ncbi:MAG: LD-carboxypeptidase [Bacteroidetes bacterium]|nr:LD-carboxypeptidase [Bacteroidota bacterium]
MIRPASLKKGDKIAIVSPARSISFAEVHPAIRVFNGFDLEVALGSYIFSRHNQFAGTDERRLWDFQLMLDDDEIRAIICSRGGYGTVRIIDKLDFTRFCANPKWIVGYSDATILHAHIHQLFGIETLHAVMPVNIGKNADAESVETMANALFGQHIAYNYPVSQLSRKGEADGILIGGNLSILYNLSCTVSSPDTAGKILFIEDVDEYLYHIDRMMINMKRSGKLSKLRGLIVGGMTGMKDNAIPFGKSANEIIAEAVKEYSYPVCYDFPAGHLDKNLALIMGRQVRLKVNKTVEIIFY